MPAFGQTALDGKLTAPAKELREPADLVVSLQDRLTVSDTVRGILSYARWPDESHTLRLCVVGQSKNGEMLLAQGLSPLTQRAVATLRVSADAEVAVECDALYVGALDEASWRRLFSRIAGTPVLTLAERSQACLTGSMFCLDVDTAAGGVPFEVNLDAVARSGVRVNPLVLRLGRRVGQKTS